jgi:hypothetical protein
MEVWLTLPAHVCVGLYRRRHISMQIGWRAGGLDRVHKAIPGNREPAARKDPGMGRQSAVAADQADVAIVAPARIRHAQGEERFGRRH